MNLSAELGPYMRACYTGIWIRTFEPNEALRSMAAMCREEAWNLAT
ncbi:MAG: hypothetical protein WD851_12185 [Pirellulales bacterium]